MNDKPIDVSRDEFRLEHYKINGDSLAVEDIVHSKAPYFHYQVLRPENEKDRSEALEYFDKNCKTYVTYTVRPEILLYVGCTELVYIRSKTRTDWTDEEFDEVYLKVGQWFILYGDAVTKEMEKK
jgi:hypothetical protein